MLPLPTASVAKQHVVRPPGERQTRARMHHKVVGNFRSEADFRSRYFRGFRFSETSDNGACTHGQPAK